MQRSCDLANAGVRLNRTDSRYTKIGVPKQEERRYKTFAPPTDFLISPQASHLLLPRPLNQAKDQRGNQAWHLHNRVTKAAPGTPSKLRQQAINNGLHPQEDLQADQQG